MAYRLANAYQVVYDSIEKMGIVTGSQCDSANTIKSVWKPVILNTTETGIKSLEHTFTEH